MALFDVLDFILNQTGSNGKMLPFKVDKALGQSPLHYAFKNGNLECALWIIQLVRKEQGYEAYSDILNCMD
jgi:hypothetical protein